MIFGKTFLTDVSVSKKCRQTKYVEDETPILSYNITLRGYFAYCFLVSLLPGGYFQVWGVFLII
jgi:hypothetical protein